MTREISELMDGELSPDTTTNLIVRMKQDGGLREDWGLYHLIGDALRQSAFYSPALMNTLSERLSTEPTVLAPRQHSLPQKLRNYLMSGAVAVAAVATVVWFGLRVVAEPPAVPVASHTPIVLPVQQGNPSAPLVAMPMQSRMNDYLLAHQEYSPTTAVQGVAGYVRNVPPEQVAGR
jgi:sigma-E factor negative regulatory protein RseA